MRLRKRERETLRERRLKERETERERLKETKQKETDRERLGKILRERQRKKAANWRTLRILDQRFGGKGYPGFHKMFFVPIPQFCNLFVLISNIVMFLLRFGSSPSIYMQYLSIILAHHLIPSFLNFYQ